MFAIRTHGLRALRLALPVSLVTFLAGCSTSAPQPPKPPVSASLGTPTALFLAAPARGASLRLQSVQADASFTSVEFRDEDGKPVAVAVDELQVLSKDWVFLHISPTDFDHPAFEAGYVLLRVADGKLFDANAFNWAPQVKGDTLYAVGRSTDYYVVRVDLAAMLLHPMSNPTVDFPFPPLVVDGAGNVRAHAYHVTDNINQVPPYRIFFADNAPPLADPWGTAGMGALEFCDGASLATTYGEDGHVYSVCARNVPGGATTTTLEYFVREVSFTSSGTTFFDAEPVRTTTCTGADPWSIVCGESRISGVSDADSLRPRTRLLLLTSGFFTVTPVPGGGISLAWTDLPLPEQPILSGGFAYWQSGDSILRVALAAGASVETMVTSSNLITWQAAGGAVVFTKYLTGTDIATYRVTAPGVDPVLISSSDMQVQQVQEL